MKKIEVNDEVVVKMNTNLSGDWQGTSGVVLGFPVPGVAIVQLAVGWYYEIVMILVGDLMLVS